MEVSSWPQRDFQAKIPRSEEGPAAAVAKALAAVEETISALSYAEQAAGIKNRPAGQGLRRVKGLEFRALVNWSLYAMWSAKVLRMRVFLRRTAWGIGF